jgi:hypothetical protein
LNYKEGRDEDIKRFVEPFLKLIRHSLAEVKASSACLVPVPSSIDAHNIKFSTVPRPKGIQGSRNRDNRNTVFCNMLAIADGSLSVNDILIRKLAKAEKATWSPAQHAASLECRTMTALPPERVTLVVIDDVRTDGGTLQGARIVLENATHWRI